MEPKVKQTVVEIDLLVEKQKRKQKQNYSIVGKKHTLALSQAHVHKKPKSVARKKDISTGVQKRYIGMDTETRSGPSRQQPYTRRHNQALTEAASIYTETHLDTLGDKNDIHRDTIRRTQRQQARQSQRGRKREREGKDA